MADRALAHLYGYPILRRQDPFKVNLVWGMTHARDPKQMFLKTHEEKNEEAEQAGIATDRHPQTDSHRQKATDRQPQTTDKQPQTPQTDSDRKKEQKDS